MMSEFVPNLDDGELWIPSDILVADVPNPTASKTAFPPPPPHPELDLARHFASFSFPSSQSQRFGTANQYALTAPPTPTGPPPTHHPTAMFVFPAGSSPNPVLLHRGQADGLTTTHLYAPQTRLLYQNRVSRPLPGARAGAGVGTGVFLPRASATGPGDATRRKQWVRNRNTRIVGGWYHDGHAAVPPADKALPRDWSY